MSLILDALRKADQERQATQQAPGLDTQQALPVAPPRRALLIGLIVLIGVLLTALLAWWWLEYSKVESLMPDSLKESPGQPVIAETEQQRTKEVQADTPAPMPYAFTPEKSLPALLPESEDTTEEPVGAIPTETPTRRFDAHYLATQVPAAEDEAIQQLYQQPPVEDEPVAAVKPEQTIGGVRDLPLSVQNRIPTLMYTGHFFEQEPAPSVIINSQRLYKGGTISGMTIEDIYADGVVLRLDSYVFKLNALSSWVNM